MRTPCSWPSRTSLPRDTRPTQIPLNRPATGIRTSVSVGFTPTSEGCHTKELPPTVPCGVIGRHPLWRWHHFRHDVGSAAFVQSQGGAAGGSHVPGLHRLPDRRVRRGHDRGQSRGVAAPAGDVAGLLPGAVAPLPAGGRRPRTRRDVPGDGDLAGSQRGGDRRGGDQPSAMASWPGRIKRARGACWPSSCSASTIPSRHRDSPGPNSAVVASAAATT